MKFVVHKNTSTLTIEILDDSDVQVYTHEANFLSVDSEDDVKKICADVLVIYINAKNKKAEDDAKKVEAEPIVDTAVAKFTGSFVLSDVENLLISQQEEIADLKTEHERKLRELIK